MKINKKKLVVELNEILLKSIATAETFKTYTLNQLNKKETENSWSILECIEHLNRYDAFYLPEISDAVKRNIKADESTYSAGKLGNYFANSMKVKPKLNKMKTFKNMNPIGSELDLNCLNTFINNQLKYQELLKTLPTLDLKKLKTGMTLTKLLKFRLGDTFRFIIYHQERHIAQAKRVQVNH